MGLAHVVGTQAGRHRFYTLAFAGKQQARAIGLQRDYPIQVPRGDFASLNWPLSIV